MVDVQSWQDVDKLVKGHFSVPGNVPAFFYSEEGGYSIVWQSKACLCCLRIWPPSPEEEGEILIEFHAVRCSYYRDWVIYSLTDLPRQLNHVGALLRTYQIPK